MQNLNYMFYIELLIYYVIAINVIAFIVYGIDKLKAKRHWWRIPEATLLTLAAIGGSIGAWCGMMLFRHKTKHLKFRFGVPLIFLLQFALVIYVYAKC